jgi:uncharacterized protein involved in exopolysaccharide biosynthesis
VNEQNWDLESFFRMAWRHAWIILLGTLVGHGLAMGMMELQDPIWKAETTVVVSPLDNTQRGSLYGVEVLDLNIVGTYVQLLRSRGVVGEASDTLARRYGLETLEDAVIDVRPIENSSVIVVSVRSSDRNLAIELANAVVTRAIEANPVPVLDRAYPLVVVDSAATGNDPVSPNHRIGLLLGTLAGAILGLGGATLFERRGLPRAAPRAARSAA